MSFIKSGAIVAFFTFLSRVFGYIRDIFMASLLGTGPAADAFAVAFRLPNFFRTLFAEGAFSAAFVPMFAGKLSKDGKTKAMEFADKIFTLLLIALLIFTAILQISMPVLMYGLAPGFISDPSKFELTKHLSYITVPYLLFISLASCLCGMMNSVGRFAASSALPILLNLSMIGAIYFLHNSTETPAHALAIGVFIAGIVQLLAIIIAAKRAGLMVKIVRPKINDDVKKLFKNMLPVIMGSGITQINLWVGTIIATHIAGAVSLLYYAERLNQFPLAIIGTAIGTVLLPTLSRQLKSDDSLKANYTQNRAMEVSLLLSLPCAVALSIIGEPIVVVLFQREAFSSADSVNVARALRALAIGLPAFVMIKVLTPRYFAMHDTKTPVKISIFCLIVNVVMSLVLIQFLSHVGIALAASIAGWCNVILLSYILSRRRIFTIDEKLKSKIIRILISCFIMGGVLYLIKDLGVAYEIGQAAMLGITITFGGVSYIIAAIITRALSIKELKDNLLKSNNG